MKNLLNRNPKSAFTLIELLVVISIITLLAGLVAIGGKSVYNKAAIKRCQAEMQQIKSAIETYKAKKGFYPPSNPSNSIASYLQVNPLYYELVGMKKLGADYVTLDGQYTNTTTMVAKMGVRGFANYSPSGAASDDAAGPEKFLKDIRPKQAQKNSDGIVLLISPLSGPDQDDFNPWFYNSHNPTNNPDGYDLWTAVNIGGKTNLICNWSDRPIVK